MTTFIIGIFIAIIIAYVILGLLIMTIDDMQTVEEMYRDYIAYKRKDEKNEKNNNKS